MAYISDTQRDREMILDPYKWPLLYLPLKRKVEGVGWPEIGLLRTATRNPNEIFRVQKNMSIYGNTNLAVEDIDYEGVDALLADGWRVD